MDMEAASIAGHRTRHRILLATKSIDSFPSGSPFAKEGRRILKSNFSEGRQEKRSGAAIWQNSHAISTLKWAQGGWWQEAGEAEKRRRAVSAGSRLFQKSFGFQQRQGNIISN
jgi:hypothetical protein